jgi:hypothetical protein
MSRFKEVKDKIVEADQSKQGLHNFATYMLHLLTGDGFLSYEELEQIAAERHRNSFGVMQVVSTRGEDNRFMRYVLSGTDESLISLIVTSSSRRYKREVYYIAPDTPDRRSFEALMSTPFVNRLLDIVIPEHIAAPTSLQTP